MKYIEKFNTRLLKLYIHLAGTINNFNEVKCYYFLNENQTWKNGELITKLEDYSLDDLREIKFKDLNFLNKTLNHDADALEVFKINFAEDILDSSNWEFPIHYLEITKDSPLMNLPNNLDKFFKKEIIEFLEGIVKPSLSDMTEYKRYDKNWIKEQDKKVNRILYSLGVSSVEEIDTEEDKSLLELDEGLSN